MRTLMTIFLVLICAAPVFAGVNPTVWSLVLGDPCSNTAFYAWIQNQVLGGGLTGLTDGYMPSYGTSGLADGPLKSSVLTSDGSGGTTQLIPGGSPTTDANVRDLNVAGSLRLKGDDVNADDITRWNAGGTALVAGVDYQTPIVAGTYVTPALRYTVTADRTITDGNTGSFFSNLGATGQVNLTLFDANTGNLGNIIHVRGVTAAQVLNVRVDPNSTLYDALGGTLLTKGHGASVTGRGGMDFVYDEPTIMTLFYYGSDVNVL